MKFASGVLLAALVISGAKAEDRAMRHRKRPRHHRGFFFRPGIPPSAAPTSGCVVVCDDEERPLPRRAKRSQLSKGQYSPSAPVPWRFYLALWMGSHYDGSALREFGRRAP